MRPPQVAALLERPDPLLPERTELAATPFFPQELYQCGPAALARWPDHLLARIGLGNSAYALGDLAAAEMSYRRATLDHPEAADAWNNLAQVLLELNRRSEARAAAERAVALGGPRLAQYQATLRAIAEPR